MRENRNAEEQRATCVAERGRPDRGTQCPRGPCPRITARLQSENPSGRGQVSGHPEGDVFGLCAQEPEPSGNGASGGDECGSRTRPACSSSDRADQRDAYGTRECVERLQGVDRETGPAERAPQLDPQPTQRVEKEMVGIDAFIGIGRVEGQGKP